MAAVVTDEPCEAWKPDLTRPAPRPAPQPADDVLDLIRGHFSAARSGVAVLDAGGAFTYGELDALSGSIAAALDRRGVRSGQPVVVSSGLNRWAIAAILGVMRAGARYVPIDTTFPPARRALLAQASGATVTVTPDTVADLVRESGGAVADRTGPFAYTQFTSGSTGTPKAVTIPTAALAYSTAARIAYYGEPVGRFLLCSSISFDSSVAGVFWTLATGGTLVVPAERPTDVVAVAQAAQAHQVTHTLMIPSLYEMLLAAELRPRLRSLRTVVVAGEACPPRLVGRHFKALPEARLHNEYGPTECTVWSTVHECGPADADLGSVPIGGPIPGASLDLRQPDGGPTEPGEVGELWVGGPGVAVPHGHAGDLPVYRTGDLVRLDGRGRLEFHGRTDHQVKVGGFRLDLAEVENMLAAYDTVAQAAVGVAERRTTRPFLTAFVTPADDKVDVQRLRTHLLERLPALACPGAFVECAELPLQPNGKLDRRELDRRAADLYANRRARA
jgi:D-alanine--poly(phosphoribitol) ligase subunit 1